jgi:hypothetical protein
MVRSGEIHDFMRIVQGFMRFMAMVSTIPWSSALFGLLPKNKDSNMLYDFSVENLNKRMAKGQSRKDVFSYLLAEDKETKIKYNRKELIYESRLVIVGGKTRAIEFNNYESNICAKKVRIQPRVLLREIL